MSEQIRLSDSSEISAILHAAAESIAKKITKQRQAILGDVFIHYDISEEKLLEYARYEIAFLANAIADHNTQLFTDYVEWLKELFQSNMISLETLAKNFEIMQIVLFSEIPSETHDLLTHYFQAAHKTLAIPLSERSSFIDNTSRCGSLSAQYLAATLSGDRATAVRLIMEAFATGVTIEDIYLNVLEPCQKELGLLWLKKCITVGQEHFASAVTQLVMSLLYYPYIAQLPKTRGTLITCCAPGELHEIGARMFADLCELRGWHVIFLGANISSYRFVDDVMHSGAELVGISATMPTSIAQAAALIKKIKTAKISDVKIIIGGYAFTQSPALWQQTGADFYAENAQSALAIIDTLAKKT